MWCFDKPIQIYANTRPRVSLESIEYDKYLYLFVVYLITGVGAGLLRDYTVHHADSLRYENEDRCTGSELDAGDESMPVGRAQQFYHVLLST